MTNQRRELLPRRRFLLSMLALPAAGIARSPSPGPREYAEDFDAAHKAITVGYPWLGDRAAAWNAAVVAGRERALRAPSRGAFAQALATALESLHEDNAGVLFDGHPVFRRVPADTDAWAQWQGGMAVVTGVRSSGNADVAGLHPGQSLVSVQGVAIERVMRELLQREAGRPKARDWALRRVLAGPREGTFRVGVREPAGGAQRQLEITRSVAAPADGAPLLVRRIGEKRDLGYLRIRNRLADPGLVMHFDAALHQMKDTRGLLLDLRETEYGGSEAVVAALLGRFAASPAPWQQRQGRPGDSRHTDTVGPRGPFAYEAPVVVLVDRWTAGEGEALACGLRAVAGARLVGTDMARLHGRAVEMVLPHSQLAVRFPIERTYSSDGSPRELARPDLPVDLAAPSGGPADPILYQGLRALEK